MAELLLQVADDGAGAVSGARSVHPVDEAEEHIAAFEGRRADYAPGAGILRLIISRGISPKVHRFLWAAGLVGFGDGSPFVSPIARAPSGERAAPPEGCVAFLWALTTCIPLSCNCRTCGAGTPRSTTPRAGKCLGGQPDRAHNANPVAKN